MTIPYERTRAVLETKAFLERLLNPRETPRVPRVVRAHAKWLLRHYPSYAEIELVHEALPDWYGPVPPFNWMRASPQTDAVIDASTHRPDSDALKGPSGDEQ